MGRRLLSVLLVICLLCSCSSGVGSDYFAYRKHDFSAEVRGRLGRDGMAFGARIDLARTDGGWHVSVTYLTPETLAETEVVALCNDAGETVGKIEIRRKDHSFSADGDAFSGLLLPAVGWLSYGEIASVRKENRAYFLTFSDGASMQIGEDGMPRLLESEKICMETVWIEMKK